MIITAKKITDLNGNIIAGAALSLVISEEKSVTPIVQPGDPTEHVEYDDTMSMLFAHGLDQNLTLVIQKYYANGAGAESMVNHGEAINPIDQEYPIDISDATVTPSILINNEEIWGFRFYFSGTKYMVIGATNPRTGFFNRYYFYEEPNPMWLFNFGYQLPSNVHQWMTTIPWYNTTTRDGYFYYMVYYADTWFRPDKYWFPPQTTQPGICQINTNPQYPSFDLDDVHTYFTEINTSSEWDNDSSEENNDQNGDYNDSSDTIGNDALPDGCLNSSLINNYYLGNADNLLGGTTINDKLDVIGQWLCDFDFGSSFSNRLNSLVSLKLMFSSGDPDYDTTDTYTKVLHIGGTVVDHDYSGTVKYVNAGKASQFTQHKIVEDYKVQKYFGNFLDYAPYTKIQIYLPFCGLQELDPSLVIDKNLTIWLKLDWITGDIVYTIHSNGTLIYHFTGNSCFDIPISASDYGGKVTSLVSTAISAATMIGGAVAGNAPIAVGGAMGIAGNLATLGQKVETYTKGTLTNTFSMMDKLQPYLIITRPIQVKATSYASEKGYPSQLTANLGSVQGYCKIAEWKLQNIPNIPKEVVDRLDNLAKTEGLIL